MTLIPTHPRVHGCLQWTPKSYKQHLGVGPGLGRVLPHVDAKRRRSRGLCQGLFRMSFITYLRQDSSHFVPLLPYLRQPGPSSPRPGVVMAVQAISSLLPLSPWLSLPTCLSEFVHNQVFPRETEYSVMAFTLLPSLIDTSLHFQHPELMAPSVREAQALIPPTSLLQGPESHS